MSYWEVIPFDILTFLLSYFDFEDPATIEKLSSDPYIRMKLGIDDENGHLWKFIVSTKLTRNIPTSSPSMKDRYYQYINVKKYIVDDIHIFKFAVERGYEILVRDFVERNINFVHVEDDWALSSSCRHGNLDLVKYLVEQGAIIQTSMGSDPLVGAATNGHLDILSYLIERGADVNGWPYCALNQAVKYGQLEIVEYLVNHGTTAVTNNFAMTSNFDCKLFDIAKSLQIIKCLVNHGANIRFNDDYVFRYSAEMGYLEIVRYAVEQGADIHIFSDIAFKMASRHGHLEIIKYLESL